MRTIVVVAAMMALSGCDSTREALGLTRHSPDETQVVPQPSLTLPPEYTLRPPGTETPVSGAHPATPGEQGAAPAPVKEEDKPGFFSRTLDSIFGEDKPEQGSGSNGK